MKCLGPAVFLLCCLTALQPCVGQTINLDSLWTVWNDTTQPDTNRLKAIQTISWDGYLFSQPDSAFYFAGLEYKLARRKDITYYMAMALNTQGVASGIMGNYDKAFTRLILSYSLFEKEGNKLMMARLNSNMGILATKQGNYLKAIEYYARCLKVQEELKDNLGKGNTLNNLGLIYSNQDQYEQAINYYSSSLKISQEHGSKISVCNAMINLGDSYQYLGEYAKAKNYLLQCLKLSEEIQYRIGAANSLIGLGVIDQKQGNHSKSMDYFNRALEMNKNSGDMEGICASLLGIAVGYSLQRNYPQAIEAASNALEMSQSRPLQTRDAAKALHTCYKAIGQDQKALEMHELYIQMRDSINSVENKEAVIRQQFRFSYENQAVADSLKHVAAINEQGIKIQFQNRIGRILLGSLAVLLVFLFLLFKRFQVTRDQKRIIETASRKTNDSIQYAERIQQSILPSMGYIENCLNEFYILYKPKDIVSGDFYWVYKQKNGNILIALADCTGHGVPGAFMSMIGTALLNEIVIENGVTKVNTVLDTIRTHIISSFEQEDSRDHIYDGMDITLIDLNTDRRTLSFSGAGQQFYLLRDGTFIEVKGNNYPVGYYFGREAPFDIKEMEVIPGDQLYLFTDGIIDQFGGDNARKFSFKRLKEVILKGAHLPMHEQNKMLDGAISSWQGDNKQTDDISVMGLKIV